MRKMIGSSFFGIALWAWRSYVAALLWRWFAEPVGAPHITVVRMMGLGLLVKLAIMHIPWADTEARQRQDKTAASVLDYAFNILGPLLVLGFGWVYAQLLWILP